MCDNGQLITPLGLASLSGNSGTCNLLLKSGADANVASGCGSYCLHLASLADTSNAVEALIAGGGNVEHTDAKVEEYIMYTAMPQVYIMLCTGINSTTLCMLQGDIKSGVIDSETGKVSSRLNLQCVINVIQSLTNV